MRLRGSRRSARKRLMRSARMGVGSGHLCGGWGTPDPGPLLPMRCQWPSVYWGMQAWGTGGSSW